MASFRKERLEELIKRVIGDTLITEVKDPRIGFASVHRVELSSDFFVADVFISVIGDDLQKKKTIEGLESAKGYIRHKIIKEIKIKSAPEVKFHLDDSIEKGVGMVDLLTKLTKEQKSLADAKEKSEGGGE